MAMADRAGLKMKKIFGQLGRSGSIRDREPSTVETPRDDSPQAVISREITAFCEAGGPNAPTNAGEEYLHLPAIVDAAESSPAATSEAATRIRKLLSKDNHMRAYAQYNAIMLMRILTDNPGRPFTRNFDSKFISVVKELLREGKDMSVQQILRETLDNYESEKVANNETLEPIIEMWKKEKAKLEKRGNGPPGMRVLNAPAFGQHHASRHHRHRGLPPPEELASRIEEAKTTAKLLIQTVQSTPNTEIEQSDLIREFADRVQSASRSVQSYIHSNDPAPDEDTLLTLIETNDLLSTAMSRHSRALLQARRTRGTSPNVALQQSQQAPHPPASPPPRTISTSSQFGSDSPPPQNTLFPRKSVSQASVSPYIEEDNPFGQPAPQQQSYSLFDSHRASPLPGNTPPPSNQAAPLQPAPLAARRKASPANDQTTSHPRSGTTYNYQGRQDSAANDIGMHRAPQSHAVELEDRNTVVSAFANSGQRPAANAVGQ